MARAICYVTFGENQLFDKIYDLVVQKCKQVGKMHRVFKAALNGERREISLRA